MRRVVSALVTVALVLVGHTQSALWPYTRSGGAWTPALANLGRGDRRMGFQASVRARRIRRQPPDASASIAGGTHAYARVPLMLRPD
jgi:hypothetical protein